MAASRGESQSLVVDNTLDRQFDAGATDDQRRPSGAAGCRLVTQAGGPCPGAFGPGPPVHHHRMGFIPETTRSCAFDEPPGQLPQQRRRRKRSQPAHAPTDARKVYRMRSGAHHDAFDYIEMFCNPIQKHARNGVLSPVEFERQHNAKADGVWKTRGGSSGGGFGLFNVAVSSPARSASVAPGEAAPAQPVATVSPAGDASAQALALPRGGSTSTTLSSWRRPSRAVQEIAWPSERPIRAAPMGVITDTLAAAMSASSG